MALRSSVLLSLALGFAAVACSSTAPTLGTFENGSNTDDGSDSNGTDKNGVGNPQAEPANAALDACATSSAQAEQLPLHMVLVLDQSGSMCEFTPNQLPRDCGNSSSKWQQVTTALKTFFSSAASKGITVSLIAFPAGNACSSSTYATPLVGNVALPDSGNALGSKMSQLNPNGSTPTRQALEGALTFGKTVNTQFAGKGKVAIVMATDGLPQDCNGNSIQDAANVAAASKDTIPTYVIGVGNLLDNLNTLAAAGGTNKAFLVSTANNGTVGQEFSDALAKIRGASLSCEYGLPAPPAGQTLDFKKVNVQVTAGGGTASTLPYSADCSNTGGWRYDNEAAPTKIELCTASCDKVKGDGAAKIDLVLGCETQTGTVR